MGTKFFAPKPMSVGGINLQARALGAGSYAAARDAGGVAKDIAAAQALYKAQGAAKPLQRSAAYPPGPKGV